jgi:hypothetical protein
MAEFYLATKWFFLGFVAGLLTPIGCKFLTELAKEVKIAKQQWHNPHRRNSDEHAP